MRKHIFKIGALIICVGFVILGALILSGFTSPKYVEATNIVESENYGIEPMSVANYTRAINSANTFHGIATSSVTPSTAQWQPMGHNIVVNSTFNATNSSRIEFDFTNNIFPMESDRDIYLEFMWNGHHVVITMRIRIFMGTGGGGGNVFLGAEIDPFNLVAPEPPPVRHIRVDSARSWIDGVSNRSDGGFFVRYPTDNISWRTDTSPPGFWHGSTDTHFWINITQRRVRLEIENPNSNTNTLSHLRFGITMPQSPAPTGTFRATNLTANPTNHPLTQTIRFFCQQTGVDYQNFTMITGSNIVSFHPTNIPTGYTFTGFQTMRGNRIGERIMHDTVIRINSHRTYVPVNFMARNLAILHTYNAQIIEGTNSVMVTYFPAPNIFGYRFLDWRFVIQSTSPSAVDGWLTVYLPVNFSIPIGLHINNGYQNGVINFRAQYERMTVTVTFRRSTGQTINTLTLNYNERIATNQVPNYTPTNHAMMFTSWQVAGGGELDITQQVRADKIVNAQAVHVGVWTITFIGFGGRRLGEAQTRNGLVPSNAVPTPPSYPDRTFSHWWNSNGLTLGDVILGDQMFLASYNIHTTHPPPQPHPPGPAPPPPTQPPGNQPPSPDYPIVPDLPFNIVFGVVAGVVVILLLWAVIGKLSTPTNQRRY